jgi:catalase (peroxidase I)
MTLLGGTLSSTTSTFLVRYPSKSANATGTNPPFASPVADMIALGTIMSSAACSGPIINFKAGRVDARDGGAFGVPDPDISAEEFHERMERVGYNKTEGIQFVACGHTIGWWLSYH